MPGPLEPVTLTGESIRLEPMTRGHLDGLAAVAFAPDIFRWFTITMPDRPALEQWVAAALAAQAAGTALPFVTVWAETGKVIGSTRFMNASPADGRYEIGSTWLHPDWQRTAANTEAKFLMLRHAFESMGARRVELKTHSENAKSRAAIERLGAVFEGTHRNHMRMPDGSMRHSVWYSIIDTEWPAVKARLTARLAARRGAGVR